VVRIACRKENKKNPKQVPDLGNSKPCIHCTMFIKACGIKTVYYSVPGGLIKVRAKYLETDHESAGRRALIRC